MSEELTVEGAGSYHLQKVRRRPDLRTANIGFNVLHDVERQWGSYRPVRNLPVAFTKGHYTDKEGYVFTQGKVLGKYDRRINDGAWKYQDATNKLGVSNVTTGQFYAYKDATGASQLVDFADPVWGNSPDIVGFLAPFNGNGTTAIQEKFGTEDVNLGIIDPVTGNTPVAGTTNAALRAVGTASGSTFELCGVSIRDTMRETRNNHAHYMKDTEAFAVAKRGYMTLPLVVSGATGFTANVVLDNLATLLASTQRAVSLDQTVLFVTDASLLQTGNVISVDAWGNPFITSETASGQHEVQFGTLVDFTEVITAPFGRYVQTYPDMEVAGTGTGGLMHDVFYLARKLNPSLSVEDIAYNLTNSAGADYLKYGYATIYFDIP